MKANLYPDIACSQEEKMSRLKRLFSLVLSIVLVGCALGVISFAGSPDALASPTLKSKDAPNIAAATPARLTSNYSLLKGYASALCLTVAGTADYTGVFQAPCNTASTAQQWTFVGDDAPTWNWHVVNHANGKCLTVPGGTPASAVMTIMYTCRSTYTVDQNWAWVSDTPGAYKIISDVNARKCISVPFDSTQPTFVGTWDCVSGLKTNQLWVPVPIYS
jgi:hypothetical protein